MAAWLNNMQKASYKEISFEVLSIDDCNEKSLVEHGRPFVNGVDIEDMGTQGRNCQMSAIFMGAGFDIKMTKLMKALEEQGAGVLVHPIFGRLQNMIASNWSFRTEAEMINYVAVDITFKEVTESAPLFVFENEYLVKLEEILSEIDDFKDQIMDYLDLITNISTNSNALWGKASSMLAVMNALVTATIGLFGFDRNKITPSAVYSQQNYQADMKTKASELAEVVQFAFNQDEVIEHESLTTRIKYNASEDKAKQVNALPDKLFNRLENTDTHNDMTLTDKEQAQPLFLILNLMVITNLISMTVNLIETDSETVDINELMHINNQLRTQIQSSIDLMRITSDKMRNLKSLQNSNIYVKAYQIIEILRKMASQFNAQVLALINQKPPLRVMQAKMNGTIHQFAHELYRDIQRDKELIRLNPHLRHPSFIHAGDWINYYAQ